MNTTLRSRTVKLIARVIRPFVEEGIIQVNEENFLLANLKHLAAKGELTPEIMPKLIDQTEAADMLGLGLSNFKKLEKGNAFSFKRRMVGSSVRYRNVDVIRYILAEDNEKASTPAEQE